MATRVYVLTVIPALLAGFSAGCGADQKSDGMDQIFVPASAVSDDAYGSHSPPTTSHHDSESSNSGGNNATSDMTDDQKNQIRDALRRGGTNASACITMPGAKTTGEGEVQ